MTVVSPGIGAEGLVKCDPRFLLCGPLRFKFRIGPILDWPHRLVKLMSSSLAPAHTGDADGDRSGRNRSQDPHFAVEDPAAG